MAALSRNGQAHSRGRERRAFPEYHRHSSNEEPELLLSLVHHNVQENTTRGSSAHSILRRLIGERCIAPRAVGAFCLVTLCTILVAGLWPFHSPRNEVSWVDGENALLFGKRGTALSRGRLAPRSTDESGCSVEVWLKAALTWTRGSVVAFYDPKTGQQFSVQQDFTDLMLQLVPEKRSGWDSQRPIRVDDVFRKQQAFIAVTSDGHSTAVYIDGRLATRSVGFRLLGNDLSGQVILANSPLRNYGWPGELKGLAIYRNELTSAQVAQHYRDWTHGGEPKVDEHEKVLAVYRFNEGHGNVIHNAIPGGGDLEIPKRLLVVDQLLFESPVAEFHTDRSYAKDALINVAGFVPLGFILALYFTIRRIRRANLITIFLGATVSTALEYLQSYLPTRYSGVTDIVTNTLGTCIGVLLCSLAVKFW